MADGQSVVGGLDLLERESGLEATQPLLEVAPQVAVGQHRPVGHREREVVVFGGQGGQHHLGHCEKRRFW